MSSSLKRAVLGAVAVCLVAVALVAPLGVARGGTAAAADVSPGNPTCIPVKGQVPRPDLAVEGLTPSGAEVVVRNIGCGPTLGAFNVRIALTDGHEAVINVVRIEQFLRVGDAVRVSLGFDCQFATASVQVDPEQISRDSNPDNNTGTFTSNLC